MNAKELVFWTFIWGSAVLVVFIPGKTTILARLLGIERGYDAFVFIGIVTIFYIVYRLYVKVNEIDQTITELIRQIALGQTLRSKSKKLNTASSKRLTANSKVFKAASRKL